MSTMALSLLQRRSGGCKPLLRCTADDYTPADAQLREDCIDYLAHHGRSVTWLDDPGRASLEHVLRLCAEVDDATVHIGLWDKGDTSTTVVTLCEGGFAGHYASPATIAKIRASEAPDPIQDAEDEADAEYFDLFGFADTPW